MKLDTLTLCLVAGAVFVLGAEAPALAWSTDPAPSSGAAARQYADPDEAVDNIANGGQPGGTELSVGRMNVGTGTATPGAATITIRNTDAEPVNPGWPLWMRWHNQ